MVTRDDIESFLIRMDVDFDELEEGMWLVRSRNDGPPTVVHLSTPVLIVRLKVMDLSDMNGSMEDLYRKLLVLNATDVVHGAYGIEEEELILSDTLELETLDFQELRASVESLQFAAESHLEDIRELAGIEGEG